MGQMTENKKACLDPNLYVKWGNSLLSRGGGGVTEARGHGSLR